MAGAPFSSSSSSYSSSMSSHNNTETDELRLSEDRNFALHGEIMMLILVLIFFIFLLFLLVFLYKKKQQSRGGGHHRTKNGSPEQDSGRKLPVVQFKTQLDSESSELQHQHQEFKTMSRQSVVL
ncbi:putative Transmembrane protein [Melia azedarach]|uniref:Transmembrane protein n=1 Tax=Melia azedarach TaxID=155640 RepID=A0ACC1WYR6_MELAZ|nr:putative Transmembrane protein [Melia azedarach]